MKVSVQLFTIFIVLLYWSSTTEGFGGAVNDAKKYVKDFYGGSQDLYDNYM